VAAVDETVPSRVEAFAELLEMRCAARPAHPPRLRRLEPHARADTRSEGLLTVCAF